MKKIQITTRSGKTIDAMKGKTGTYFLEAGALRKLTPAMARKRGWTVA